MFQCTASNYFYTATHNEATTLNFTVPFPGSTEYSVGTVKTYLWILLKENVEELRVHRHHHHHHHHYLLWRCSSSTESSSCCVLWHITVRTPHGTAPPYLADSLRLTLEVAARRRLRSVDSPTMLVPSTCRSTLSDRAFPVAAARAWNSLPQQTRAASSLLTFRRETKSHLFRQSFGWWKSGAVSADWQ